MELPSKTFEREIRESGITKSGIIARNQKWFQKVYIDRTNSEYQAVPVFFARDYHIEPKIGNLMEVGKAYTFTYDAKYKDTLDFWNVLPHFMIVISHYLTSEGKLNCLGINMGFIPPQIRMQILDKIVKMFSSMTIDPNIRRINKGQFHSLKHLPLYYDVTEQILQGSGYKFAIRSYIYQRIKSKPMIITYEDWWKVATFPTAFIKKMTIRQIYYLYKKNIRESYRIGQKDEPIELRRTKAELKKYLKGRK